MQNGICSRKFLLQRCCIRCTSLPRIDSADQADMRKFSSLASKLRPLRRCTGAIERSWTAGPSATQGDLPATAGGRVRWALTAAQPPGGRWMYQTARHAGSTPKHPTGQATTGTRRPRPPSAAKSDGEVGVEAGCARSCTSCAKSTCVKMFLPRIRVQQSHACIVELYCEQVVPAASANDWFRFASRPHQYWDHRASKQVQPEPCS